MRPRLPAPTIRLRLTLVYGGLFTLSAAALLAITFVLVNHQYTGNFFISSGVWLRLWHFVTEVLGHCHSSTTKTRCDARVIPV